MTLGTVRVDETIMRIVDLRLIRGGIQITTSAVGPIKACEGPVRLFSPEGQPVTDQAAGDRGVFKIPDVEEGYSLDITINIAIDELSNMGMGMKS